MAYFSRKIPIHGGELTCVADDNGSLCGLVIGYGCEFVKYVQVHKYFSSYNCRRHSMMVCKICGAAEETKPLGTSIMTFHMLDHYGVVIEKQQSSDGNMFHGMYRRRNSYLDPYLFMLKCVDSSSQREVLYDDLRNKLDINIDSTLYEYLDKINDSGLVIHYSCIICDMDYECLPTLELVVSHLTKSHNAINNVDVNISLRIPCNRMCGQEICNGIVHAFNITSLDPLPKLLKLGTT